MNSALPSYLRLHVEQETSPPNPLDCDPKLKRLADRFERVTGWSVTFQETAASYQRRLQESKAPPSGRLAIDDLSEQLPPKKSACHRVHCEELLESFNETLQALLAARHELWLQQAESATSIPVVARQDDQAYIASRLQTSLRAAVEAAGAKAAGLYVLDEATSKLELRATWGQAFEQFEKPHRTLDGCLADLEALLGHAVVLEDTHALRHWHPPEPFASAVCVPVSSATTPLGTLWIFDDTCRDYSTQQTNLVEVVAGRIAAELEREVAVAGFQLDRDLDRQVEKASRWQQSRLPNLQPLIDELDVQGWTQQAGNVGGDFHFWTTSPNGKLIISLGDVQAPMLEAGLGAANLQALAQCHAEYQTQPAQVLSRVAESLWTGSMGDQDASLLFGVLDPRRREVELAMAGGIGCLLLMRDKMEVLSDELPPLGGDPDVFYPQIKRRLKSGDLLVAFSDGVRHRLAALQIAQRDEELAQRLASQNWTHADQVIEQFKRWLNGGAGKSQQYDTSLLVVRAR